MSTQDEAHPAALGLQVALGAGQAADHQQVAADQLHQQQDQTVEGDWACQDVADRRTARQM